MERTRDRVMRMKLEIECEVWHIISCYAPQVGCTQEEKYELWEHVDADASGTKKREAGRGGRPEWPCGKR